MDDKATRMAKDCLWKMAIMGDAEWNKHAVNVIANTLRPLLEALEPVAACGNCGGCREAAHKALEGSEKP